MKTFADSGNWDNCGNFETSTFPTKVAITLLSVNGLWGNWLREDLSGIEGETEVSLLGIISLCANESVIGTAGIKATTNKQKITLIGNFLNGWSLFHIFRIYTHPFTRYVYAELLQKVSCDYHHAYSYKKMIKPILSTR